MVEGEVDAAGVVLQLQVCDGWIGRKKKQRLVKIVEKAIFLGGFT